jgi:1-acyl-sn-glycerol-3-phosphate acyltransferase
MVAKTGLARLAITTKAPVIPIVQWGTQIAMPTYGKKIRLFPRSKVTLICGQPLDFSPWFGKENDPQALIEATAYAMRELTTTLEEIRGEKRPPVIFDPHTSTLPRTGNFKKEKKK